MFFENCVIKLALVEDLFNASIAHSDAVMLLSSYAPAPDLSGMADARKQCEESRRKYDTARAAFNEHCTEHGC
jgi:hypothetical protein